MRGRRSGGTRSILADVGDSGPCGERIIFHNTSHRSTQHLHLSIFKRKNPSCWPHLLTTVLREVDAWCIRGQGLGRFIGCRGCFRLPRSFGGSILGFKFPLLANDSLHPRRIKTSARCPLKKSLSSRWTSRRRRNSTQLFRAYLDPCFLGFPIMISL